MCVSKVCSAPGGPRLVYQTGFWKLATAPALAEGRVPSTALPGVREALETLSLPSPAPPLLAPLRPCSGDTCLLAEGGPVASLKKIKGTSSRALGAENLDTEVAGGRNGR